MLGWKVDHTSTASDALTCAWQQCGSSSTSKQCFRLPCNDLWKRKFRSGFRTFSASRRERFSPSEAHPHTNKTHLLRQMLLHYWARARARRVSGWPPSCRSTLHAKHIYLGDEPDLCQQPQNKSSDAKVCWQLLVKAAEQIFWSIRRRQDIKKEEQERNDRCLPIHPSRRTKVPQNIKRQPIAEAINILNSPISRYRAQILAWNVSQSVSITNLTPPYRIIPERSSSYTMPR